MEPNKPEISPRERPIIAADDQIIFRLSMVLNDSLVELRLNSDSIPIPNKAAATILVAIGSTSCQPNKVKNFTGAKNIGMANNISAIKCITNHRLKVIGTDINTPSFYSSSKLKKNIIPALFS